jgi:hypothetical protein
MAEELLEAQAVEEEVPEGAEVEDEPGEVRRLPERKRAVELDVVRSEVTTAALAAAGGVVAGAATVAVVRAIGAAGRNRGSRVIGRGSRGRRPSKVVASRSFLVDVHLLGDK